MQAGFITAPHAEERSLEVVRQLIRNLVETLPPTELCQQAAINLALPNNMIDSTRVLRLANSEANLSTLQFTALQLRNLHKEVSRLKNNSPNIDFANNIGIGTSSQSHFRRPTKQQTVKIQKSIEPQSQYWSILENEVAKRSKLKQLCSQEKLDKKMEQLRKKAQKAKIMNKRALKIYKNQQEKEQNIFEHYKPTPIYQPPQTQTINSTAHFTNSLLQQLKTDQMIDKIDVVEIEQPKNRNVTNFRVHSFDHEKYNEYRRRELQTREKKRIIEERNHSQALLKVIKKQEKIRTLRTAYLRKKEEETQSQRDSEVQLKTKIKVQQQIQLNLTQKCLQTSIRRQLRIQEKVNRIREELKQKEQRRIRHRQLENEYTRKIVQQSEQTSNSHMKFQISNELSLKQEKTIRSRYQQLKQKQNLHRFAVNIAKLSDKQLQKAIQAKYNSSLSQLVPTG